MGKKDGPCFRRLTDLPSRWSLSPDYKDDLLETTFEIGQRAFPWVEERRDRSVTEVLRSLCHGVLTRF